MANFEQYILFDTRVGKNAKRNACITYLKDQISMGVFPKLTLATGMGAWAEFYKLMPAEHREPAGKLWREFQLVVRQRRRYPKWGTNVSPRPPRPGEKFLFQSSARKLRSR